MISDNPTIKAVLFDIDGVLTDGRVTIDAEGNERKSVNLRDIDAVCELKRHGFKIGAITGEGTEITKYFEKRFPWDFFYRGCKDKVRAIKEIESASGFGRDEICYVGDGKYDIGPIEYAGLAVCPGDAIAPVRERADLVLGRSGEGAIWELVVYLTDDAGDEEKFFRKVLFEHTDMFRAILADRVLQKKVMDFASLISGVFERRGRLLIFGNGGSAGDAQHIATEFVSKFYRDREALDAEALTVNTSSITAIGNDYTFDKVFARQVEAKARDGDVLLGISTSGTSRNVLLGLERGKELGGTTVLLTGRPVRGYGFVDTELNAPSDITPRIQEAHIFIGHLICEYVESKVSSN